MQNKISFICNKFYKATSNYIKLFKPITRNEKSGNYITFEVISVTEEKNTIKKYCSN